MKKFKHIWIFSDSIKGHEIQSQALASGLSDSITLFHCTIRQPWLSFAPRILPGFGKNIIWEDVKPEIIHKPDAIITCGRRMAAVGKYYKRLTKTKHIQILNPGDNPSKYDLLICPEHDQIQGDNIITTLGSLHNISVSSLANITNIVYNDKKGKIIGLLLGNPAKEFFNNIKIVLDQIESNFPNHSIQICASRRTPKTFRKKIKGVFSNAEFIWFDEKDGDNPYLSILANSDIILATADSINMVSEACASDKPVIALAQEYVSPKHQLFIQSLSNRLSEFDRVKESNNALHTLEDTINSIVEKISV